MSVLARSARSLPWFDRKPLESPVWWMALAVLLINDGLLKGRGIVPGWLTGKLSDFAFLVVAPVLLACLLPRKLPWRRTFALTAVVGLYVTADLSRGVSDAVIALAAKVGLTWKLWPDPTDLLALLVLPATVWLLRAPALSALAGRPSLRQTGGVVLGAVACLATSAIPGDLHRPFLVNLTPTASDVKITWVLRKVDCKSTPEVLAATLNAGDLDDPRTLRFTPGDVAALDSPPPMGASAIGQCHLSDGDDSGSTGDCVAAILEAPAAEPVLVLARRVWYTYDHDSEPVLGCSGGKKRIERCQSHYDLSEDPGLDAVSLVVVQGKPAFRVSEPETTEADAGASSPAPSDGGVSVPPTKNVVIATVDPAAISARAPSTPDCRSARDAYHAGVGVTACAEDSDCGVVAPLKLPGEGMICDTYVNQSVLNGLRTAANTLLMRCVSDTASCDTSHPAICHEGKCAPVCPGVYLPTCQKDCEQSLRWNNGHCATSTVCFNLAGESCTCTNDVVTCREDTHRRPGCPISCVPASMSVVGG